MKMKFEKSDQIQSEPVNISTEIDSKLKVNFSNQQNNHVNDIFDFVFSKKSEEGLVYLIEQISK